MRSSTFPAPAAMMLLAFAAPAHAADDVWTSGFGQGVLEAHVDRGPGNNLTVTCDLGAGRNLTGISFLLRDREPQGSSLLLTFDGADPVEISLWDGAIPSDCRACAGTFVYVLDRIKRHNTVNVRFQNGDSATFSLRGSSRAIGDCPPDFAN